MVQYNQKVECITVRGENFDVSYYLTEASDGYGVLVEKNTKDGELIMTSSIKCLFIDRERTMEFIEKIAKGFVTPISLLDIAYNYICE